MSGILRSLALGLLGVLMVVLVGSAVLDLELDRSRKRFEEQSDVVFQLVAQRLNSAEAVLATLANMHQASVGLSNTELTFVSESILADYGYVSGVAFLRWLAANERAAFERQMRLEGFAEYRLHAPDGADADRFKQADEHLAVSFFEPLTPRTAVIYGADLLAGQTLSERVYEAIESGRTIAVEMQQFAGLRQGLVLLRPLYRGHFAPESPVARRQQVQGAALLLIDPAHIVRAAEALYPDLSIGMGASSGDAGDDAAALEVISGPWVRAHPTLALSRSWSLDLAGSNWRIEVKTRPAMQTVRWTHVAVAVSATAGVVIVFGIILMRRRSAEARRQVAEAALFAERERAQVTLQSIGDAVITTESNGVVRYVNPSGEQLLGVPLDDLNGKCLYSMVSFLHEDTRQPLECAVEDLAACMDGEHELILVNPDGREVAVDYTASALRDREGREIGSVLVLRDVSRERELTNELAYQATHDPLTALPNRRALEVRLREALHDATAGTGRYALCYLDLDQFKLVNDTCGHVVGDQLLKQVAPLLAGQLREPDLLARLGGDEFGALLVDCDMRKALEIAERLRDVVASIRFESQGKVFEIGVSIGVVAIDRFSGPLTDILSAADVACYTAKERGRNCVNAYQSCDQLIVRRHGEMQWLPRIKAALENDRLVLHFQRIRASNASGADADLCEILVRMINDDGAIVPPMAFIPAAERYDLMPRVDRWVLKKVTESIVATPVSARFGLYNVNLSGQSLGDSTLTAFMLDQIERTGVEPKLLCFEITETAAISNLTEAGRFIAAMRRIGCRFALDDFGAGLSSFGYLKHLPIDYLKIDGQFVRNLAGDSMDRALVETIHRIGELLAIRTIAESVEDQATLDVLREIGIDFVQGYHIHRPQPLDVTIPRLDNASASAV